MTPPEDREQKVRDLSQTAWTDEELAWSQTMARLILGPALPDDEDDLAPLPAPLPAPLLGSILPEPTAHAVGVLTVEATTKTVVDARAILDPGLPPDALAERPPEEEQP